MPQPCQTLAAARQTTAATTNNLGKEVLRCLGCPFGCPPVARPSPGRAAPCIRYLGSRLRGRRGGFSPTSFFQSDYETIQDFRAEYRIESVYPRPAAPARRAPAPRRSSINGNEKIELVEVPKWSFSTLSP